MENYQLFIEQFGSIQDCIKGRKKELTPLKTGQVRVAMLYAPINPSDLIPVTGAYRHRIALPSLLGYEGVGRVVEVADLRDANLLGKRVLPLRGEGTWQRFVTCTREQLILVPDGLADVTAAQAYINPLTALVLCKEVFNLKSGDSLLINVGFSSIGKIFSQLSQVMDFHLISVVRKTEQKAHLEKNGVTVIVSSDGEGVYDRVMALTNGQGVFAAVDSVGGNAGTELVRCVKEKGYFRTIGLLSGRQVDWPYICSQLPISAEVFHLRHTLSSSSQEDWQSYFNDLFNLMLSGQLILAKPTAIYPIEDYKKALKAQEHPGRQGKIMFQF